MSRSSYHGHVMRGPCCAAAGTMGSFKPRNNDREDDRLPITLPPCRPTHATWQSITEMAMRSASWERAGDGLTCTCTTCRVHMYCLGVSPRDVEAGGWY
ncbi:hypothetical protein M404DRAFT_187178 [Pisolithus tinctorius Marx 270]|uniref:Uncharacterized protein n=1 Tax=Pisolithus tinctorius Marx 270 TaxID=870435 RepID=A0A0C3PKJ8_PISTI|nr:hypothetical protein M404DRAFT_187178 [Pisolithus tinctorius Marx 270]